MNKTGYPIKAPIVGGDVRTECSQDDVDIIVDISNSDLEAAFDHLVADYFDVDDMIDAHRDYWRFARDNASVLEGVVRISADKLKADSAPVIARYLARIKGLV